MSDEASAPTSCAVITVLLLDSFAEAAEAGTGSAITGERLPGRARVLASPLTGAGDALGGVALDWGRQGHRAARLPGVD